MQPLVKQYLKRTEKGGAREESSGIQGEENVSQPFVCGIHGDMNQYESKKQNRPWMNYPLTQNVGM